MKALGQLPARTFSILMSLEPAAASICALIFLQEHLAFNEIVAFVVILQLDQHLPLNHKPNLDT
jgi:inner membrane transporter RhtA